MKLRVPPFAILSLFMTLHWVICALQEEAKILEEILLVVLKDDYLK